MRLIEPHPDDIWPLPVNWGDLRPYFRQAVEDIDDLFMSERERRGFEAGFHAGNLFSAANKGNKGLQAFFNRLYRAHIVRELCSNRNPLSSV